MDVPQIVDSPGSFIIRGSPGRVHRSVEECAEMAAMLPPCDIVGPGTDAIEGPPHGPIVGRRDRSLQSADPPVADRKGIGPGR